MRPQTLGIAIVLAMALVAWLGLASAQIIIYPYPEPCHPVCDVYGNCRCL